MQPDSGAMRVREQKQVPANKRQLCMGAAAIADGPIVPWNSICRQGQINIPSLRTERERDGRRGGRWKSGALRL